MVWYNYQMIQVMKNNKMWEIKGQSLGAIILTLLLSVFVAFVSIINKNIIFFIISGLILILWSFSAFKMTILKGDKEKSIYLFKYWSKKQIWKIPYKDIRKIHISYLSDTTFNNKNVYFFTSYGSFKCKVYGIYLSDFIKLFNTYDIPVYKEIEGKYILISD